MKSRHQIRSARKLQPRQSRYRSSTSFGRRGKPPRKKTQPLYLGIVGGAVLVLLIIGTGAFYWKTRGNETKGASTITPTASLTPSSTSPTPPTPDQEAVEPAPITPSPTPIANDVVETPDFAALKQHMLQWINQTRAEHHLQPVEWNPIAEKAGQEHAEEMVALGYLSHWNMDGYGPDYRYIQAGGADFVQENIASYTVRDENGQCVSIDDWDMLMRGIFEGFMDSQGHRKNILNPAHTHVGIGMAYDALTGEVRVAQEFTNHYLQINSLPLRVTPGASLVINGNLLDGASNPQAFLKYEPFPEPLSLDELNQTKTFLSPATLVKPLTPISTDKGFVIELSFEKDASPGIYHLWIQVDLPFQKQVPAIDRIIEVKP